MSDPRYIHHRHPTLAEVEQFQPDDFRGCGWLLGWVILVLAVFAFCVVRSYMKDAHPNSLPKQESAK